MSVQNFFEGIIYEYADRIVDSSNFADRLVKQVIENRLETKEWDFSRSDIRSESQMDVEEIDNESKEAVAFFGDAPRALRPLWERNGRRHEIHASKSDSGATLLQVKAIRQKLNGACGYYSLFHSSMSIIARECSEEQVAVVILRQMFNRALFFVMMARWKILLLQQCVKYEKGSLRDSFASQHWKSTLVRTGVIERLYMDHLLATDKFIGAIKHWTGTSYHALPEISLSQLKSRLSVVTLQTVDEISKQLAVDDKPHAFLIGQLNHWIAIVSNRVSGSPPQKLNQSINDNKAQEYDDSKFERSDSQMEIEVEETKSCFEEESEGEDHHIETILLDSRNDFVLNMGPSQIDQRVDYRVKREFKPTGSLWHEMCIGLYRQSLCDTQYSCDLFHALTTQSRSKEASKTEKKNSGKSDADQTDMTTSNLERRSKRLVGASKKDEKKSTSNEPHPITTELILLNVKGFFEKFQSHVGDEIDVDCNINNETWINNLPKVDMMEWLMKFTIWVQEYAPLRSTENGFIGSLKTAKKSGYNVPESIPKALTRWSLLVQKRIKDAREEGLISENDDADVISKDFIQTTVPWIDTSCKYLLRKR